MGMNESMKTLFEGIERPNRIAEGKKIEAKWAKTGLLEGLIDTPRDRRRSTMARLLESEASWLMTEAASVADIAGFQNVAFPVVRRVFAGLIANELVSVQPMSLPSGLLFYLDYRFDTVKAGNLQDNFAVGGSLFGNAGSTLGDDTGTGGFYNLGNSFSQREIIPSGTFSGTLKAATLADIENDPELSASLANYSTLTLKNAFAAFSGNGMVLSDVSSIKQWVPVSGSSARYPQADSTLAPDGTPVQAGTLATIRRHTVVAANGNDMVFVVSGTFTGVEGMAMSVLLGPTLTGGTSGTLVLPEFESDMNQPPGPAIPELDFRLQSQAVTAGTRKLRARWTPELAQDLAAYQNLDAEVELTQVLSEAIAIEIDREILADLLYKATGANFYWSRKPGNFVDKTNGNAVTGASFTGTVREWYETLIETIIDVANNIHRKTLRGAANFVVTSPDVCTILEASVLYKPMLSMDTKESMFTVGTEKIGSLNTRFTVYKDPYFPRNKVLVGFKGGSFLETGYVYAPYVPLIVTPTIYAPDDFTPRKGVMTRYAKTMVRPDFYGSVLVLDMNVI